MWKLVKSCLVGSAPLHRCLGQTQKLSPNLCRRASHSSAGSLTVRRVASLHRFTERNIFFCRRRTGQASDGSVWFAQPVSVALARRGRSYIVKRNKYCPSVCQAYFLLLPGFGGWADVWLLLSAESLLQPQKSTVIYFYDCCYVRLHNL
jgi:hypothetical protein